MKDGDMLKRFGAYSLKLAELLRAGARLDSDEMIFIENHLLIVQLALTMSKCSQKRR